MDIQLLVLDADGVLTDRGIVYPGEAEQIVRFDGHDGAGIKRWLAAGRQVAILTGRGGTALRRRAAELGVPADHVVERADPKRLAFEQLIGRLGVDAGQVAYMGDDLADLEAMRSAGWSIAPADAVDEVRRWADAVTDRPGGRGAVREAIDHLLRMTAAG